MAPRRHCDIPGNHDPVTGRRRYLVTYDIADDRRRLQVFRLCREEGDWVQFSVFVADFTSMELVRFKAGIQALINAGEDQVLIADLGAATDDGGKIVASVGRPYQAPVPVLVV